LQFSTNKVDVEKIKDVDVILRNTSGGQKELIFQATEAVKTIPKGLSILVTHDEKKVIIVGAKSKGLKISLSDIVKKLSAMVGGSGGGNGDIAIGGGPKVEKAKDILKEAKRIIEETL
jgi:alanyl-tRNA synthetase